MSHEINTQLEEELEELKEEVKDCRRYRDNDLETLENAVRWLSQSNANLREAELRLESFKQRMQHD